MRVGPMMPTRAREPVASFTTFHGFGPAAEANR